MARIKLDFCGICENKNPDCKTCDGKWFKRLDDEAERILRADAEAKGMGWSEYLKEAGLLTPHAEREIRRRERQLKSGQS